MLHEILTSFKVLNGWMAHSCPQLLNLSTQLKDFNSNHIILTKRGLGRVRECSCCSMDVWEQQQPLQEKLAVTARNVRNFRTLQKTSRWSEIFGTSRPGAKLSQNVRNFRNFYGTSGQITGTSAAGKNSPAHQLKNGTTFSSGLRFRWIWTFRKAYSEGYPTQLKPRSKTTMWKCCDKFFSQVSTWVS